MTAASATTDAADRPARRNAIILAIAGAINGSAPPIAVTLGGLAGAYLLGADKTLATLPVTGANLGVAIGAIPAALLMRRTGRRLGYMIGSLIGIAGALIAALAIVLGTFVGFFAGLFVLGIAGAFVFQYRFAAADAGSPALRARAVSWVFAGGLVSAVLGPQTVIFTRDLLAPVPFAGAFVALAVLTAIGMAVLTLLGGVARQPPPMPATGSHGRPLLEIARQPRFIVAVLCAMISFGIMSLVMTAAPLAMIACGLGEDNAALGIQWHVMAMFAPSFFTGSLIARFGREPVTIVGLAILVACAIVALTGIDLAHFWTTLILLGIGWNFSFIGATTLLGDTYRPEEKSRVEGLNDALVFGTVALGSFSSGSILAVGGWDWVVYIVFPAVGLCLLALAWLHRPVARAAS